LDPRPPLSNIVRLEETPPPPPPIYGHPERITQKRKRPKRNILCNPDDRGRGGGVFGDGRPILVFDRTSYRFWRNICSKSIYLSIGINVRFAAMMADVGDGLL